LRILLLPDIITPPKENQHGGLAVRPPFYFLGFKK